MHFNQGKASVRNSRPDLENICTKCNLHCSNGGCNAHAPGAWVTATLVYQQWRNFPPVDIRYSACNAPSSPHPFSFWTTDVSCAPGAGTDKSGSASALCGSTQIREELFIRDCGVLSFTTAHFPSFHHAAIEPTLPGVLAVRPGQKYVFADKYYSFLLCLKDALFVCLFWPQSPNSAVNPHWCNKPTNHRAFSFLYSITSSSFAQVSKLSFSIYRIQPTYCIYYIIPDHSLGLTDNTSHVSY